MPTYVTLALPDLVGAGAAAVERRPTLLSLMRALHNAGLGDLLVLTEGVAVEFDPLGFDGEHARHEKSLRFLPLPEQLPAPPIAADLGAGSKFYGWESIDMQADGSVLVRFDPRAPTIAVTVRQKVKAPWPPGQVAELERWQATGWVHPFTCECGSPLVPTQGGWFCNHEDAGNWVNPSGEGPYRQDWAWDFMLDGSLPAESPLEAAVAAPPADPPAGPETEAEAPILGDGRLPELQAVIVNARATLNANERIAFHEGRFGDVIDSLRSRSAGLAALDG